VTIETEEKNLDGSVPLLVIKGWNMEKKEYRISK
jgi:hypothetical protein